MPAVATTQRITVRLPQRSDILFRWFAWWVRGYVRKHFDAVRLARGSLPVVPRETPLVVVLNHPSWWDPLIGMVLTERFPDRTVYAPFDAKALSRYSFFDRLGFYGVEPGSMRGAKEFLQTTTAILSKPGTAVWITAQGRFSDPRERPVRLRPGVGHLAARLEHGVIVPLALEYPFWNERLPEALGRFGDPLTVESGRGLSAAGWLERIEAGMEATQDALAADALTRDPDRFETLLSGTVAIGGLYDRWRAFTAWLRGSTFHAEHDVSPTRTSENDA